MKVYLVGVSWFIPSMGDHPNAGSFPVVLYSDYSRAEAVYKVLAEHDDGGHNAYMVEMDLDGQAGEKQIIHGSDPAY